MHIDECGRLRTVRSTHPARSASGVEDGAIREGSPVQSVRGSGGPRDRGSSGSAPGPRPDTDRGACRRRERERLGEREGVMEQDLPQTMGYEAAGIFDELGEGVTDDTMASGSRSRACVRPGSSLVGIRVSRGPREGSRRAGLAPFRATVERVSSDHDEADQPARHRRQRPFGCPSIGERRIARDQARAPPAGERGTAAS